MRARTVRPGHCDDESLFDLPLIVRHLYLLLPMLADRAGRLEDRPRWIKAKLLRADSCNVNRALRLLEAAGKLIRYEVDGRRYLQLTDFAVDQRPHPKEAPSLIPPPPAAADPTMLSLVRIDPAGLEAGLKDDSTGQASVARVNLLPPWQGSSPPLHPPLTDQESDPDSLSRRALAPAGRESPPPVPDGLGDRPDDGHVVAEASEDGSAAGGDCWPDDDWADATYDQQVYALYPRKTHEEPGRLAWRRLMAEQPDFATAYALATEILGAINEQAPHWTDPRYTPPIDRYITDRRWQDRIVVPTHRRRRA